MITRQTTKANQQLIEEPLVTTNYYDSDNDLVIMTEVFKLPTLDRKSKKDIKNNDSRISLYKSFK